MALPALRGFSFSGRKAADYSRLGEDMPRAAIAILMALALVCSVQVEEMLRVVSCQGDGVKTKNG
jgi:hypothetical protein